MQKHPDQLPLHPDLERIYGPDYENAKHLLLQLLNPGPTYRQKPSEKGSIPFFFGINQKTTPLVLMELDELRGQNQPPYNIRIPPDIQAEIQKDAQFGQPSPAQPFGPASSTPQNPSFPSFANQPFNQPFTNQPFQTSFGATPSFVQPNPSPAAPFSGTPQFSTPPAGF